MVQSNIYDEAEYSLEKAKRDAREGRVYYGVSPAMTKERQKVRALLHQYNQTDGESQQAKALLAQLLPNARIKTATITPPIHLDHGDNIIIGENTYINFCSAFCDQAVITIGNDVMIGPNCAFYTPNHPIDPAERRTGSEIASPITIEDDVWLGGNVTVCPGVTIGRGTTIGAGSVVVKSIPPFCVAVGNPCKVIKQLPQYSGA